jgi:general secretion pathway protein N
MRLRQILAVGSLGAVLLALPSDFALSQAPPLSAPPPSASAPKAGGLPPLEELTATRERPLFAPDRRPDAVPTETEPEPDAAPVEEEPTELAFELAGIVIGPEIAVAVLHNKTTNAFVRLRRGETIEQWKVEEITARQVVLRRDNKRVRLQLFEEEKSADSNSEAKAVVAGAETTPRDPDQEPDAETPPEDPAPQKPPRRRMPLNQLPKEQP